METDNVFSDQMQVSRPQFCILFRAVSVCIITDSRDIVCQRVKPYINDMLIVKINRNSPLKRSSGYAQILKSRKKEVVHHLIFSGNRLNKFRMCINMLDQTVCVFAHFEEVSFLFGRFYFTSTVRTFTVYKL